MSGRAKLPESIQKKMTKCYCICMTLPFCMSAIQHDMQKITSHSNNEPPTEAELDAFLASIDRLRSVLFDIDISIENMNNENKEN